MRRLFLALSVALFAFATVPAGAVPTPIVAKNVELIAAIPDVAAISTAFSSDTPHMYVSTLKSINVYDISDVAAPKLVGLLPFAHWENEAVSVGERYGERADGTKFVLVGLDLAGASPDGKLGTSREVVVVDVTDPAAPKIRSRAKTTTSTHTVSCVNPACTHAYSAGTGSEFSIVDLSDLDAPKEIKKAKTAVGGFAGHDWDGDAAGIQWHTGAQGTVAFDVTDPANPVAVAGTNAAGKAAPYNDFIHHNSYRPNADAFEDEVRDGDGKLVALDSGAPDVERGNVLLVTEEDYDSPTCGAGEGSFQTWHVPYLDAEQFRADNPRFQPAKGAIAPLDRWNTELLDSGIATPAGAFCSAHYFDYHHKGFVAQGWYQQGTRILDVRDPRDIKQVGYFFTGASETWVAYWLPERNPQGRATGRSSDVIVTNDASRGIEILKVSLPTTAPGLTKKETAPVLPQWLTPTPAQVAALEARKSPTWGYACPLTASL